MALTTLGEMGGWEDGEWEGVKNEGYVCGVCMLFVFMLSVVDSCKRVCARHM